MRKKSISVLALSLSLVMFVGACSPAAPNESTTDSKTGDISEGQTSETDEPKRELTILIAEPTTLEDVETNYGTQYLEEKTGIDLTFNYLPSSEWLTKFEIMVTGGDYLSDILLGTTSELIVGKYGANGVFQDMTPYYEASSKYIKPVFEENPMYKSLSTFADGKMYAVPRLQEETHMEYPLKYLINRNWLDNLKLDVPSTTDELVEVFKAFRDDDPNGNGESDEVIVTGNGSSGTYDPTLFFMSSFTFVNLRHYLQVDSGQLSLAYTKDEWREGLRFVKSLLDEGYLDPMMFTQDLAQFKSLIQREGDNIVGSFSTLNTTVFDGNEKMLDYEVMSPLKGPNGVQYSPHQTLALSYNAFITRDAKNPELAFEFLDYTWDPEASMVIRYGEESVDWEYVEEGTKGQLDSSGFPATYRLTSEAQQGVQNKWWNVWSSMYLTYDIGNGRADDDNPMNGTRIALDGVSKLIDRIPDEVVGQIVYTADESAELAELKASLDSYWQENKTLFIIGDIDLDNDWDNYLEELNNIGLERYLEVTQIAYERTYDK